MDAGQVVGAIMAFDIQSIGIIIFDVFGDIQEYDESVLKPGFLSKFEIHDG